jgi:L-ascorbate metabolism protein UlaG (beta-lactamase superfamily)
MHWLAIQRALLGFSAAFLVESARAGSPPAQEGVDITFLANEGVMLAAGGKKVLIDALYVKYRGYALPAPSTQATLAAAQAPFDAVDLILATHHHGDHFHPSQVAAHMRANPRATLLTSQQVLDSLSGRVRRDDPIRQRFLSRTTRPGERRREVVNGITVELLGLPHGGHPGVEHLGYIVTMGGRRVLHVGDTDFSEETFAPFRLDTARIDVALLPYGAVTGPSARRMVDRWIRPRQIVAFHVDESDGERVSRAVQAAAPGAVTFYRSLEKRRW